MKKFDNALFDFDGTLFDTSEGVFNSFDHVVDYYGLNIPDKSVYNTMIGPPLQESFTRVFKLPESEIQNAIAKYREYYTDKGMFEIRVYDGVLELLDKLLKAGKKTFVATSKPEEYAEKILDRKGMKNLFTFIGGADMEEKVRVHKVDVINHVLAQNNLTDKKESCLMIGDRLYDLRGAQKAGIESCGILWGFGTREEMIEYKADYICRTPDEVLELFI